MRPPAAAAAAEWLADTASSPPHEVKAQRRFLILPPEASGADSALLAAGHPGLRLKPRAAKSGLDRVVHWESRKPSPAYDLTGGRRRANGTGRGCRGNARAERTLVPPAAATLPAACGQ